MYFIDGNTLKSVQLDGTKLTSVDVGVANSILPLKLHSYKVNVRVYIVSYECPNAHNI